MGGASKIEWTERVWNPIRGCSRVSPGCQHCYAERVAHRFSGPGQPYEGLTHLVAGKPQWTGEVRLVPEALGEPLHWRKPCRVFVNSMSDLFHEDVPDGFLCRVFKVMGQAERHTFQVLTKRADRMQRFLREQTNAHAIRTLEDPEFCVRWPYPNVWCGVSVEDQQRANERIPPLLQTPAAVRFVSAEPLLGPVDLTAVRHQLGAQSFATVNVLVEKDSLNRGHDRPRLDWVIVGGESGPGARPMRLEWARSLVTQCREAGVAVFCKQIGTVAAWDLGSRDAKGGRMEDWPVDLRVREFPAAASE
jgi:protein gp37